MRKDFSVCQTKRFLSMKVRLPVIDWRRRLSHSFYNDLIWTGVRVHVQTRNFLLRTCTCTGTCINTVSLRIKYLPMATGTGHAGRNGVDREIFPEPYPRLSPDSSIERAIIDGAAREAAYAYYLSY